MIGHHQARRVDGRVAVMRGVVIIAAALAVLSVGPLAPHGLAQAVPQRIVSVVPSVTESLFAIGAGPRVVAVSSFDVFPPEVRRLPRVGALVDPDIERILSLRPDLVVVYASQADLRARLARAGIPTYVYKHGALADIAGSIRELGTRLGLAEAARTVADRLERSLADIRARVAGQARPRTLLVIGREPVSLRSINVSGGLGFLHELLETAGGHNVFGNVKRESLLVSTETILAQAPDVILELHYTDPPDEAVIARERHTWDILPGVPAVKGRRVFLLYGGELVVPGPRVLLTAQAFARAIHPGLMPR
jgi:iron complex transport system substrate-binding protein